MFRYPYYSYSACAYGKEIDITYTRKGVTYKLIGERKFNSLSGEAMYTENIDRWTVGLLYTLNIEKTYV